MKARRNIDEYPAHFSSKKIIRSLKTSLILIGKPFYLLLSYTFISLFLIIYITGRFLVRFKKSVPGNISRFSKNFKNFKSSLSSYGFKTKRIGKKKSGIIFQQKLKKISSKKIKLYLNFIRSLAWKFLQKFHIPANLIKKRVLIYFSNLKIPAPKLSLPKFRLKNFLIFLSAIIISILTFALILFNYLILKNLPSVENLTTRDQNVSTKIYDRNGVLLYNIYKDKNRTPVPLNKIPKNVRLATIAIEDAGFYSHPGFSLKGILAAALRNLMEERLTGGSTITQQLVKNTFLTPEKTYTRKLKEIVLAYRVEKAYSKDEILEMYLNEVSYGGTAYGIQEAARTYFGKDVDKIILAEAALLAGLPKSPTIFSPFGNQPYLAFQRQKEVLNLMLEKGFITEGQRNDALNEEIKFSDNKTNIKAPHFVFYLRQVLEEKYSKELIEKGGLTITTSLDYDIQQLAERVLRAEIEKLKDLNVTNAAAVILNPKTGEILAMVGSKDYFDTKNDGQVNVTTSLRQPGSSIKIINYAHALSDSYTAATLIADKPTTFIVDGQPPYAPVNYEGGFKGNLTLRSALAESRNVPAVRILASYGVEEMFNLGKRMGITTWNNLSDYGLSLTLGGGDVKLLDLARVYATVANYGKKPDLVTSLKITSYEGKVLEEFECVKSQVDQVEKVDEVDNVEEDINTSKLIDYSSASKSALNYSESTNSNCGGEQVLDPRVAFILTDILKDNNARAPSFGTNSMLVIPNHKEVAVKTGTSNNLRDNLTIGYNQKYLVAVWVGNNDNSEMDRIASGVTGASPIFNKIMSALLTQEPNDDWPVPDGLVRLPICPYTGTLACEGCPVKMEWFLAENKPEKACSPEWFPEEKEGDPTPEPTINLQPPTENIDVNKNLIQKILEKTKKPKPAN